MSKRNGEAEGDGSERATAPAADGSGHPQGVAPWELAGAELAARLAGVLAAAWRQRVPDLAVARAESAPELDRADLTRHVVRIGHPLQQRIWFLADGVDTGVAEVAELFLAELEALLNTPMYWQALPAQTSLPPGAVTLPYVGVASGRRMGLALGLEGAPQLEDLRAKLCLAAERAVGESPADRGAPSPAASPETLTAVDIGQVEVEASVYVGGGMYSLSDLAQVRPGSILHLNTKPGEPAVIAVGRRVVARGEVVIGPDGTLGIRLTEVALGGEGAAADAPPPPWLG